MNERKDIFAEIIKEYPHFLIRRGSFLGGSQPLTPESRELLSLGLRKLDEIPQGKDDFEQYLEFHRKISSLGQPKGTFYQAQSENLADLIEETKEPFAFMQHQINADSSYSDWEK